MIKDNYLDVSKLTDNKKIFKLFSVVAAGGGAYLYEGKWC